MHMFPPDIGPVAGGLRGPVNNCRKTLPCEAVRPSAFKATAAGDGAGSTRFMTCFPLSGSCIGRKHSCPLYSGYLGSAAR